MPNAELLELLSKHIGIVAMMTTNETSKDVLDGLATALIAAANEVRFNQEKEFRAAVKPTVPKKTPAIDVIIAKCGVSLWEADKDLLIGKCPFHPADDGPNTLEVNKVRQSWKCTKCNIGGDVFSFVMRLIGAIDADA